MEPDGGYIDFEALQREFQEHERIHSAEQARLYRQLTDEERLAHFFEFCAFAERLSAAAKPDPRGVELLRRELDREKDAALERVLQALD